MAAPPFKPVQLDCGMARLFSQLVSLRLAEIMTHSDEDMTCVIVDTIWVSAAVFPSLLPGVLWPVACALSEFALCPLEHTTIPTGSSDPLHNLVYQS